MVKRFGIRFRSDTHKNWFLIQIGTLLLCSFSYYPGDKISVFIVVVAVSMNLIQVGAAIYAVRIRKFETKVYSDDCIWFNSLVAILQVTVFSFFYF